MQITLYSGFSKRLNSLKVPTGGTVKDVVLKAGQRIVQGIVMPYVIPKNATSNESRHGGFGSTDDNKK